MNSNVTLSMGQRLGFLVRRRLQQSLRRIVTRPDSSPAPQITFSSLGSGPSLWKPGTKATLPFLEEATHIFENYLYSGEGHYVISFIVAFITFLELEEFVIQTTCAE